MTIVVGNMAGRQASVALEEEWGTLCYLQDEGREIGICPGSTSETLPVTPPPTRSCLLILNKQSTSWDPNIK